MGLSDRLRQRANGAAAAGEAPAPTVGVQQFHDLKTELHQRVVDSLELKNLDKLPPDKLRDQLRAIMGTTLVGAKVPLNQVEREQMVQDLLDELTGLGPLET